MTGGGVGAEFAVARASFLNVPSSVMAGLDPAIHGRCMESRVRPVSIAIPPDGSPGAHFGQFFKRVGPALALVVFSHRLTILQIRFTLSLHLSAEPAWSGRPLNTTARYPARGSSLRLANRRDSPFPWIGATARHPPGWQAAGNMCNFRSTSSTSIADRIDGRRSPTTCDGSARRVSASPRSMRSFLATISPVGGSTAAPPRARPATGKPFGDSSIPPIRQRSCWKTTPSSPPTRGRFCTTRIGGPHELMSSSSTNRSTDRGG